MSLLSNMSKIKIKKYFFQKFGHTSSFLPFPIPKKPPVCSEIKRGYICILKCQKREKRRIKKEEWLIFNSTSLSFLASFPPRPPPCIQSKGKRRVSSVASSIIFFYIILCLFVFCSFFNETAIDNISFFYGYDTSIIY